MASSLLPPPPTQILGDVAYKNFMAAAQADLAGQVAAAIFDVTSRTSRTLAAFADGVRNGIEGIGPELEKVHRQIAEEAKARIVEAYQSSLLGTPEYRTDPVHERNKRYAGDILLGIIENAGFVEYDEKGVYIGNTEALDAGARQWRRLNYGAGAAAGGGAEIFTVRMSNLELFLEEPGGPRPAFMIPAGRWFGREFYPLSELAGREQNTGRRLRPSARSGILQRRRETRGIRGTHWLAAGLEVVARNIGEAYNNLFKQLWEHGSEEARRQLVGDTGLQRPGSFKTTVSRAGE